MDISALNTTALSALNGATTKTGQALGLVMLNKQLDTTESLNAGMIQALEKSVNPSVGGNIDLYV